MQVLSCLQFGPLCWVRKTSTDLQQYSEASFAVTCTLFTRCLSLATVKTMRNPSSRPRWHTQLWSRVHHQQVLCRLEATWRSLLGPQKKGSLRMMYRDAWRAAAEQAITTTTRKQDSWEFLILLCSATRTKMGFLDEGSLVFLF